MTRTLAYTLMLAGVLVAAGCSKEEPVAPRTAEAEPPPPPSDEAAAPEETDEEPVAKAADTPEDAENAQGAEETPPGEKNCGGDDEPLCALGQWMDDNTRVAAEEGDLEALAAAFHKIEFMAPDPSWNEGDNAWNRIARIGAVRAEEGDLRASRKQCKACHKQWKDQYEEEYWFRDVPELPENASEGDPDLTL